MRIPNGRSFSYLRQSSTPQMLGVNGEEFDLRRGEVIVLNDEGRAEQLRIFPSLAEARNPVTVATLVDRARDLYSDPVTVEKLQGQLDTAERQLKRLLETHAPEHPVVGECRQEIEVLKRQIEGSRKP